MTWKINNGIILTPNIPKINSESPVKHLVARGSQASFGTPEIGFILKYGIMTKVAKRKLEIFLTQHRSITLTPKPAVAYLANDWYAIISKQ